MEIKQISLSTSSLARTVASSKSSSFLEKPIAFIKRIISSCGLFFVAVWNRSILIFPTLLKKSGFKLLATVSSFKEKRMAKTSGVKLKKVNSKKPSRFFLKVLVIFVALAFLVVSISLIRNSFSKKKENSVSVKGAQSSQELNSEFSFPLRNENGEEVSGIDFVIEKAELRDEIVIKGQKAKAVQGRIFVILNIKITNSHNQPIEINSRDYVRLSVNGNRDEWLAPSMHNDPVEVQAISTKYTRLGFPINVGDKDLVLRVGEINGEKKEIELNLN